MADEQLQPLKEELEFFQEHRAEWLEHYESKFVLVRNKKMIDTFTTMKEAFNEGVKRFGAKPFLIKQILKDEPTQEIPALTLGLLNARL